MPTITINGKACKFEQGDTILQVANANEIDIPQYCYHDGLSIVASCRICLVEIHAPNPRNDNRLEPFMGGKLMPSCQTPASDGMVIFSDSPKSIANQKAVMEYLLINHPLDCPVCDQAGECFLQDYSYQYGRGVSRFEEQKVKNPKKDLGPHVYLYADRCIMCTRCVRFTREVSGTAELLVQGRGNKNEIDVFPGVALDNELSANVIDLCPVGALLDKDFLFAQRVWFLRSTPSIDGITASGDNILVEHNKGQVYRVRPRENMAVNKWWITDEVRYGWKFIHGDDRLTRPMHRQYGTLVESDYERAYDESVEGLRKVREGGGRLGLMISPMLSCEDAFLLAELVRSLDPDALLAVGPVPTRGEDKVFPEGDENGFRMYAEKAPNARGVRRVIEAFGGETTDDEGFEDALREGRLGGAVLTGNYPSAWATASFQQAVEGETYIVLIDTLESPLVDAADVVIPGATWVEKAGTFENARGMIQAFEQAIPAMARSEGQIALDLAAVSRGEGVRQSGERRFQVVEAAPGQVPAGAEVALPRAALFNAAMVRQAMAERADALRTFVTDVSLPTTPVAHEADMQMVEL